MISMPYGPRCETIRFVWRKVRFRFRGLLAESRPETERAERGPRFGGLSWARGRRASKGQSVDGQGAPRSPNRFARNDANARPHSPFLWVSFRGVQLAANRIGHSQSSASERGLRGRGRRRKKLRKSASKSLK